MSDTFVDILTAYRPTVIDGLRLNVNALGSVRPHIAGGADDNGDEGEPAVFTQDQVDVIAGRARTEARRAAANELAEQLGCTVEEAKAKIAAAVEAEQAQQTETQRAQAAAEEARAAAETARAEAAAERLAARIERRLLAAGADPALLNRTTRLLDIDSDAEDAEIDADIEALKGDVPALFQPTGGDQADPPPPAGTINPAKPPQGKGKNLSSQDIADKQLERMRARRTPRPAA